MDPAGHIEPVDLAGLALDEEEAAVGSERERHRLRTVNHRLADGRIVLGVSVAAAARPGVELVVTVVYRAEEPSRESA